VTRRRPGRRRRAGFTLVELMISLLISTLLVVLILSVFTRLSFAFREQQTAVSLQQTLSAARTAIEYDARHAGLLVSQGFTISSDLGVNRHSPLRVVNQSFGPDELSFYYADASAQALVLGTPSPTPVALTVDDIGTFAAGDLVVLSTADTMTLDNPISSDEAKIASFTACVLRIEAVAGNDVVFETTGEWGNTLNEHCANPIGATTMMYKFVARTWRVDTSRPGLAPLQLDTTGGLATPAFTDQAYGIVDLQAATYFYDADGTDSADPDADGDRDWRSSDEQQVLTEPMPIASAFTAPLMMSISLVSRTSSTVEGVFTANSPQLTDPSNPTNNTIGDRASFALPSETDAMFAGRRLYRFVTFQTDLRNLGVGR
jgi:prepilin-type N-terminal cleavage/methylation domain-containing protein